MMIGAYLEFAVSAAHNPTGLVPAGEQPLDVFTDDAFEVAEWAFVEGLTSEGTGSRLVIDK